MARRSISLIGAIVLMASLAPQAAGETAAGSRAAAVAVRHTGPDYNNGRPLPFAPARVEPFDATVPDVVTSAPEMQAYQSASSTRNRIGDHRYWFALDDAKGEIYAKRFKLRGKGERIEVWVTPNLKFPGDDCRNDERVEVTDRQINYLIRQFDGNIYPKETRAFSRPPWRNGSNARPPKDLDVGPRYFRGQGDNIVVLIDNVRDAHYYDYNNSRNEPYIIGFFYSVFNELTDRNVMTIDGYDWLHRLRANPPDAPDPTSLCNSKPARPHLIEQTFAHEYQHLLHYYEDPNETVWLNEGLSDWAQTLTGYAFPERSIEEPGFDRHIQCFLGWCGVVTEFNPNPADMGPENSLTRWGDQPGEVLAEYGATYTFSELLASRYGRPFMKALHRKDGNGLRSLRAALREFGAGARPRAVIRQWAAAMAVDRLIDQGAVPLGVNAADVTVRRLSASINWETAQAYSTPGAPPNGSDFVRLRDGDGFYFTAGQLTSLFFDGIPPTTSGRFDLQLVAYDSSGSTVTVRRIPLDANADAILNGEQLQALVGTTATTVSAIVTFFDPTESLRQYAPYRLYVNGVLQPGGS